MRSSRLKICKTNWVIAISLKMNILRYNSEYDIHPGNHRNSVYFMT